MIQRTILRKYLLLRHSEEQGDVAISFIQKCKRLPRFLTKTRNDLNSQKAAMFGLDARIALAIFGVLSVIAGAALYNALIEVRAVYVLSQFEEVEKAYGQYYLNTGEHAYANTTVSDTMDIRELVDNNRSRIGWKGPYLSFEISEVRSGFVTEYNDIILRVRPFATDWAVAGSNYCVDEDDCYVWVGWLDVPTELTRRLDLKIDGVENALQGKFRYFNWSSKTTAAYMKTDFGYKNLN